MDVQPIVDRIDREARAAASAILENARQKAAAVQDESDRKMEKELEGVRAQAKREAAMVEDRARRMALLECRKHDLSARRALLDEAFAQALSKMAAMQEPQARAFGLSMLLGIASGGEVVVPDRASSWCDERFVHEANLSLPDKPNLTLSDERCDVGGGFLLRRGGMEINCSYRATIDAQRLELEAEVASLLFDT